MSTVPALDRPVVEFVSNAAFTLQENLTIDEALATLRASPPPGQSQVIYFYVDNEKKQLAGVLPARNLLLTPGASKVGDVTLKNVIALRS